MLNTPCPACGGVRKNGVCSSCDVSVDIDVDLAGSSDDPFIGSVIADRYEIVSLHGTGAMARVYRAVQRHLDREVIIKVITPELLAGDAQTTSEAVARFLVEAQAASKLKHPNVVSIFDFGRTPPSEGGLLYLVMEYLSGRDLWALQQGGARMPIPRVANLLRQVLAALGEAHYLGIAHRDVKPENIIVEPLRDGTDLVKVIDFGLAKLGPARGVTRIGQTVGTPSYMAPEQIAGRAVGSSDLYAVGVMLFELLTGQLPFNGTPLQILRKHLGEPRPDPRDVAPDRDIPAALANVCMRAMHIDPEQRWPDAQSLSDAIMRAAGAGDSRAFLSATRPSAIPPPMGSSPAGALSPSVGARSPTEPTVVPKGDGRAVVLPLVGRAAELAWAREKMSSGSPALWLGIHGAPGMGRTRMLLEIGQDAERRGARVVRARGPTAIQGAVTYAAIRPVLATFAGVDANDARLASGELAHGQPDAAAGLAAIFGGVYHSPAETRASAGAAVAWAARSAMARHTRGALVLAFDDLDRVDNASRVALSDGLRILAGDNVGDRKTSPSMSLLGPRATAARPAKSDPSAPELVLVTTSLAPIEGANERWTLEGLPLDAAARLLDEGALPAKTGKVEPLYVELLRRWTRPSHRAGAPTRLRELVEAGLRALRAEQRRLLVEVALTGRCSVSAHLQGLVDVGLFERSGSRGAEPRLVHAIYADIVLALAEPDLVAEVHAAAAKKLASTDGPVELRAHHAVACQGDPDVVQLVEDAATLRTTTGDYEGAVQILAAGWSAMIDPPPFSDDTLGPSPRAVLGQKLGVLLRRLGRDEEALRVLYDTLGDATAEDGARVRILEELVRVAATLGRAADCERWRGEALAIAERRNDRAAVRRIAALARP